MPERHPRGIIDISMLIDLEHIDPSDLPVDGAVAHAAVAGTGRKARGQHAFDLLIAATAAAAELPLYTRDPDDFVGLHGVVEVVRL